MTGNTVWSLLSGALSEEKISRAHVEGVIAGKRIDIEDFIEAAQKKLDGEEDADKVEEKYRRSEYDALRSERGSENTDLFVEGIPLDRYSDWMLPFFEKVCLVRKLRETRALKGSSRLVPPNLEDTGGKVQSLSKSKAINWLPALVVRGEGMFFEFKENAVSEWERFPDVANRVTDLINLYNRSLRERGLPPRHVTLKFVIIHTFAHLLIRQLSYDCGYGVSRQNKLD